MMVNVTNTSMQLNHLTKQDTTIAGLTQIMPHSEIKLVVLQKGGKGVNKQEWRALRLAEIRQKV